VTIGRNAGQKSGRLRVTLSASPVERQKKQNPPISRTNAAGHAQNPAAIFFGETDAGWIASLQIHSHLKVGLFFEESRITGFLLFTAHSC
jgi:hypothetical protein